ncbi:4'-phosphopantetheinyl transferase superfamily protein [Paraburkholderia sp. MM5384-R2]|uniref:4'-phosphopantetheinyl transferase family protein n=1 Tax=Paraburkholderia sp. MM5384-R2 TaxID=2723097 RepID=UPI00161AA390|nr:4'-phosphopantetheinyl transferase superfamily protein [Paraburkholderia sp. MM5384-R2]MBB5501188.1 4'-phosphopantetheinyl transferase [Paraburkholderia sp. MM5384-R2]
MKCHSSLGPMRPGHVHVWVVPLRGRILPGMFRDGLTHSERRTARSYVDAAARTGYLASRFAGRKLASHYTGERGRDIEVRKNATGQPRLVRPRGKRRYPVHVSVSHCVHSVALAFSRTARIGVDIDSIRDSPAFSLALTRHFQPSERALTSPLQVWECWTRKEALLKALGTGLQGLATLPPLPSDENIVHVEHARWLAVSLPPPTNCALACAAEGGPWNVTLFTLDSFTRFLRRR